MSTHLDSTQAESIALLMANAASEFLREQYEKARGPNGQMTIATKTKSSERDFVTAVDGASQELMVRMLQEHFPEHRVLGEEEGADDIGNPDCPYRWILDPLDGTTCFIHGKDTFGFTIALEDDGELLVGIIGQPLKDLTFHAVKGKGAYVNGSPVVLRETKSVNDAVICTNLMGRSYQAENGAYHVAIPRCGSIENYGSAAEEYGQMLLGHNDGLIFDGVGAWDALAGCLLMAEAGGKADWMYKDPNNHRAGVVSAASTEPIFEELREFIFPK